MATSLYGVTPVPSDLDPNTMDAFPINVERAGIYHACLTTNGRDWVRMDGPDMVVHQASQVCLPS